LYPLASLLPFGVMSQSGARPNGLSTGDVIHVFLTGCSDFGKTNQIKNCPLMVEAYVVSDGVTRLPDRRHSPLFSNRWIRKDDPL